MTYEKASILPRGSKYSHANTGRSNRMLFFDIFNGSLLASGRMAAGVGGEF